MAFFKDTRAELKKVVWPTGKQVVNNTVWVLVLVAVISAVVLGFDLLLEKGDAALWQMISKWIG
jgi:preprotein translocase subunit SecE